MRLIDADAFAEMVKMTLENSISETENMNPIGLGLAMFIRDVIISEVKRYPVAYDVDRVIEELKKDTTLGFDVATEEWTDDEYVSLEHAIEIVKEGEHNGCNRGENTLV